MPTDIIPEVQALNQLCIGQLMEISRDLRHPRDVQLAARDLALKLADSQLEKAVENFKANTNAFVSITQEFVDLISLARKYPGGDVVALLTPLVRKLSELSARMTGTPAETVVKAGSFSLDADLSAAPGLPVMAELTAPARGTAGISIKFADIHDEYLATFDAAVISPAKAGMAQHQAGLLAAYRASYQPLQERLGIPWYFVGLIHCLECNFNFGTHLHNGDTLMHRTVRVPAGRPTADVADPPFAWLTSAMDALVMLGFQTQTDWSLAAMLYRLERYNGFGYRRRGLASPYLWSFSDRYSRGKFVSDGKYDPDAVSAQCGAAVVLKTLIASGAVSRPS